MHRKKTRKNSPREVTEHWDRAQRAYGVSLPGDIPEPSGHICTCAPGWHWLSREVGAGDHCGPFQPDPFCDSQAVYSTQWLCQWGAAGFPPQESPLSGTPNLSFLHIPLWEMPLPHAVLQSQISCSYLGIKEIDLIVSPLKQAFNSILWGLKTVLNNWVAKRLVISVFIAHIDLSAVNPFKYPCHTGPDGSL